MNSESKRRRPQFITRTPDGVTSGPAPPESYWNSIPSIVSEHFEPFWESLDPLTKATVRAVLAKTAKGDSIRAEPGSIWICAQFFKEMANSGFSRRSVERAINLALAFGLVTVRNSVLAGGSWVALRMHLTPDADLLGDYE